MLELVAVAVTPFPLEGAMPQYADKTPFRPDAPCENQDPPDLRAATSGLGPTPSTATVDSGAAPAPGSGAAPIVADADETLRGLGRAAQARDDGRKSKARRLQRAAMRDLGRFYSDYGSERGG